MKGVGVEQDMEAFFARNPDEALTWEDCATKFQASPSNVRRVVSKLTAQRRIAYSNIIRKRVRSPADN